MIVLSGNLKKETGGAKLILKVKRISHNGIDIALPQKATAGSAGFDLRAAIEQPVLIEPGGLASIPTGIAVGFPGPEYAGLVFARSGLATRHGITLSNGVGVIDSDYTGEITVGICNISNTPYSVEPNERIAQLLVMPIANAEIVETAEIENTDRSSGGFGSTGRF